MNIIKEYGLERSGTNYIKALIEINIKDVRVLSNLFGQKHEKYKLIDYNNYNFRIDNNVITDLNVNEVNEIKNKFINDEVFYIIIVKNPASWIVSYNKCEWIKENRGPLNKDKIIRYMNRWNTIHNDWLDELINNKNSKTYGILYEDLLLNPKEVIVGIATKFGLDYSGEFKNITNMMYTGVDTPGHKNISNTSFNKISYYLDKKYLNEISPDLINLIDNNIECEIMDVITTNNKNITI
jgi:hypothetical protein